MDGEFTASPIKSKRVKPDEMESESPPKKRRTAEDFSTFCQFILEYENYEATKKEELHESLESNSPVGSSESAEFVFSSESNGSSNTSKPAIKTTTDIESEDDSYDLITCFCMKPFAGRPMIECSQCLTWVHLSCAKIRRNNIPDEFICQQCRESSATTRRSSRIRGERRISS